MSDLEIKQLIDELMTRVGSNRISDVDIRTVLKAMVDYTSDNAVAGSIAPWENAPTVYNIGELVISHDRIWKSKTAGNIGHEPPAGLVNEDVYWSEVSKSTNLSDWAPGIIGFGLFLTIYNGRFYKLVESARPFETTNIETEINAGKWSPLPTDNVVTKTSASWSIKVGETPIYEGTTNATGTLPVGSSALKGYKVTACNESQSDVVVTILGHEGQPVKYPNLYQGDRREFMWTGTKWI